MANSRTSHEILDREFLEIRAKLLELAASFDRLQRGSGELDERIRRIEEGLEILSDPAGDKAQRVQLLFSREFSANWRDEFGI